MSNAYEALKKYAEQEVDAILVNRPIGQMSGTNEHAQALRQRFPGPVLEATVAADAEAAALRDVKVVALSGGTETG